ncbi:MAG: L-seryl-tRNA(Sec) selenium transferase [Deltaproteobacteria bacterium]|nr:L-seryl-tRNA(Sec) selenium transferase [Deltaproteobacteria bacterium]
MDGGETSDALRRIPAVDEILRREAFAPLLKRIPRPLVLKALGGVLEKMRTALRAGAVLATADSGKFAVSAADVEAVARELGQASLAPIVNATGVVLHTNLGRAPLAAQAAAWGAEVSRGYANLEFDVAQRRRGSRQAHVAEILCELTGAEAALVVNNNAAAVLLVLTAIGAGREVVVSRGELVEIGGAFRIPDVMRASNAKLVEVGTTNKTHARDYEAAVTGDTAALLKVHRSNFAVVGFTAEVSVAALALIAAARGVPLVVDLGSGALVDLAAIGLRGEMTLREAVGAGADVITASGDKLLGGPQAGILVGRRALIERAARHPLARALRCDKFTLAALEATLRIYRDGDPWREIPALAALALKTEEVAVRARRLADAILAERIDGLGVAVRDEVSRVGGGSFPLARLATRVVELTQKGRSAAAIDATLRCASPPVLARVSRGRVLLDPRTIFEGEFDFVVSAVRALRREETREIA